MAASLDNLPYFSEGEVVSGFGRGSKELGIPTANFPKSVIQDLPASFECGVYYGWAQLSSSPEVYKMTMCVGWNPYYHNTVKTMETHIIHQFDEDFYGEIMKIVVLGFIRPMCDFSSLDALIKAIHNDIEVASKNLDSAESLCYKSHQFFQSSQPHIPHEKAAAAERCLVGDVDQSASARASRASERLCPNGDLLHAENTRTDQQDNQAKDAEGLREVPIGVDNHVTSATPKVTSPCTNDKGALDERSGNPSDMNFGTKSGAESQKSALSNGELASSGGSHCENSI